MEQVFIIIAVVVFLMFRQAASASRGRPPGSDSMDSGPTTRGGLEATLEDANRRALEALQRWEAKQRDAASDSEREAPAQRPSPTRREPLPTSTRERSPRVSLARKSAERERKQAYADIASMLDPAGGARFKPGSRRGTLRVDRKTPEPDLEQPPAREPRASRADAATPVHDRPYGLDESGRRLRKKRGPEVALARIERLPIAARAIVYGEILGRPKGVG